MIFWSYVLHLVLYHDHVFSQFLFTCFLLSKSLEILHEWSLVCLIDVWIFLELILLFSIWLRIFFHTWSFVDFLCYALPNLLWNSQILLYDHEISYVITRHLKLCIGVNLIHFSSVFKLIWFFEVDPCLLTFTMLTWIWFDFMILLDCLPLIQMPWNFTCIPC